MMAINEELDIKLEEFQKKKRKKEFEHRKEHGRNTAMKNITINLPILYDDMIQELKGLGIVPSRSEAIRWALREYFRGEIEFILKLQKTREKRLKIDEHD